MEKNKRKIQLSKNFFTKPRPHVTTKENLEDMIPFKWTDEVINGKKKTVLYSTKH